MLSQESLQFLKGLLERLEVTCVDEESLEQVRCVQNAYREILLILDVGSLDNVIKRRLGVNKAA